MLNKKSFLAVDFGAANIKLAEFELTEAGGLLLKQYGFKSLGQDGTQEATRESAMVKGLQDLLSEKSVGARHVNLCAPGFHTFSKFVKLPPVDTSKVTQIIQYEAQQNVPFPLEEVVWDYQILGATSTGELEVMLVAIKSDIVEGLFRTAESAGMRLNLVDVSPAALCNAFRYNYAELEGCTMLLDIGAKTSNLLFFEKGNVFSRGINIGANAITQEFARESKLGYDDAERTKIEQGFVSLGGAYEEPDNAHQAAISKIARQVLTRLHIQVNQTIQFYRQQGGSPPARLFLSGGATSMPYTAQFFSEKLNLPVEYFNPLRNLQIDTALNREELAKVAHSMGEIVGLGLRNLARCPIELNLMPKSSLKRQEFNQKKPYLIAAAFCLVLIVWAAGWFYNRVVREEEEALKKLKEQQGPLASHQTRLRDAMGAMKRSQYEVDAYTDWLEDRWYWANILTQMRQALINVEDKKEKEFNTKVGVWVEKLLPVLPPGFLTASAVDTSSIMMAAGTPPSGDPNTPQPPIRGRGRGRGAPPPGAAAAPAGGSGMGSTNELSTLLITCRSVNLSKVKPEANTLVAEAVAEELKARTNYFAAEGTKVTGEILGAEGTNMVIQFQVTVRLARPVGL